MRAITRDEKLEPWPSSSAFYSARRLETPELGPWLTSPDSALCSGPRRDRVRSGPFVAGTRFFHYDAYGSLRPDQDPIELTSRLYFGLCVHVVACGFSFYFMSYGYGRVLAEYLRANDEQQVNAANYVLVWPTCLSLLIGLVSDSFPICGNRRKGYMLIGWTLSLVMYLTLFIMDAYTDSGHVLYDNEVSSRASPYPAAYLTVSLLAACGIQIAWISSMAASVEFAQREHIHHRGRLQGSLIVLYNAGGVAAQSLTACIIREGSIEEHDISRISIGGATAILAGVAVVAVPFVVFFFQEDETHTNSNVRIALGERIETFWKFCRANVVYRVLFFITLHLILIGIFNENVRKAVQRWSHVSRTEGLAIDAVRVGSMMASIFVWKVYLRNVNWRLLCFAGSVVYMVSMVLLTVLTTFDVVRNEWFYGTMFAITELPRAWLLLFNVVLATEIATIGHEGVTVGLAISFQRLAALADFTLAAIFPKVLGFKVSDDDIVHDDNAARKKVITAFFILVAVNLLCLPVIRLLPHQKLDAQQLRSFGGYNRHASCALLTIFLILICFNLAANVVAVM